ncbi:MAG: hypothetical protein WCC90_21640 [Methylocella sp.]
MGQAAQLLNARSLAVDLNDDHVVEQASDAIEAVTSLAATRQATSLVGAAFQLLICFSRVDASFSGPDLKTREHARRDVDRLLSSAYEAIVSAAGHRPDEIIVERLLATDSPRLPKCIEAAFANARGDPVKARWA